MSHQILVVEDARFYRTIICQKLAESFDCEVVAAETYAEAKELLDTSPDDRFSVAVLDLVLPDSPGGEIIDLVTERKIPVVVFAATFTEGFRETMLEKNVFDYFIKTHQGSLAPVVTAVKRILRNREVTILVVEDSQFHRNMLKSMLHAYRFRILTAENGVAALDMLERNPEIQMVITDYDMPEMDGFELISNIRAKKDRYQLAIIGLSAQVNPMDSVKFLKNGANDFLPKPFLKEELYNRVLLNLEMIEQMRWEKEQAERLRELNAIKNKFLGMAAHDLRNPLGGISGLAKILLEDIECIPDQHREFVKAIHEASNMMLDMVNELLDVAVIESGNLDLHLEYGSLGSLVEKRVSFNTRLAERKQIILLSRIDPVPDTYFDAGKISQVIDNLLTNAIKFSPSHSIVQIRCVVAEDAIRVSVRDEGQGLSEEDQEKLFGAFQKLSARPTGGESSTGLGLSIARKIMEAHQGRIWAESKKGEGASFFFSLPIVAPAD